VHIQIAISQYSNIDSSYECIGSALARFERSTLLEHKHTRTVVLRILEIITPVKCVIPSYDGYIRFPEAGRLHQRQNRYIGKGIYQVWGFDIDKSEVINLKRGLQLLWDT
jgi:hypothetical protein